MDPDRLSRIPVDCDGRPLAAMVTAATRKDKVIPKDYEGLIPSEVTVISSLLRTPLPIILSTVALLRPAASCLVCKEPSWTKDQLMSASVPSAEWLKSLDEAIWEAWPRGANSIEYPGNPNIRFPLWVGTFWTALSGVIEERKEWQRARDWVGTLTQNRETREAMAVFERMPRKTSIWVLATETERAVTKISFFARLLSDGLLAERHIDAFVAYLNIQLRKRRPDAPGILLADLSLSVTLSNYFNVPAHKIQESKLLLKYAALFKTKAYRRLLFPAHVGGREDGHWIVFSVDFAKAEYSFGESHGDAGGLETHLSFTDSGNSLKHASYQTDVTKILRGLDRWLAIHFSGSYKNLGQTLPTGIQKDGISCGICALNALEHIVLGAPLFTHNRRNLLRVQYFTNIAELLLDRVSTTSVTFQIWRTDVHNSDRCRNTTR